MRSLSILFAIIFCLTSISFVGCGGGSTSGGGGGSQSTTITMTFSGANPTVVATQIGTGSYTQASLSGNTLTFSVPSGTNNFSIAYLCPSYSMGTTSAANESILMATVADGTSYNANCVTITSPLANLTGSIDATAIPGTTQICAYGYAGTNGYGGCMEGNQLNNFSMPVAQGTDNVLVTAVTNNFEVLAMKALSAQTVPGQLNGGNVVTFTTTDETIPTSIIYNNAPAGTTPGTRIGFEPSWGGNSYALQFNATTSYPAVPAALMTGNAEYQYVAGASINSISQPYSGVGVVSFTNSTGALTVDFPAAWTNCTAPTASAEPSFNYSSYTGFAGKSGVGIVQEMGWTINTQENSVLLAAYEDAVTNSTVTMPNLAAVSSSFLTPASGSNVVYIESVIQNPSGTLNNLAVNTSYNEVVCTGEFMTP